jgi:TonB family protein
VLINARLFRTLSLLTLTCALCFTASAQEPRRTRLAVLDLGQTELGQSAAEALASSLAKGAKMTIIDRDQSRAAALGAGYAGSLNMSVEEARNLGAVIDCDFFVTGDAQNLRRSPSSAPVYYEAYTSLYIVSARTGRLILWDRPSFEAATPVEAERRLFAQLSSADLRTTCAVAIARAEEDESQARALAVLHDAPLIEDAPADAEAAAAHGLRLPQPYKRMRPPYPEAAARIELEATIDVEAEIGADGEVSRVDVVRWAGYGLEQATTETVRQMHFRPAMRNGSPVAMRVLLRYNFRKPPKQEQ